MLQREARPFKALYCRDGLSRRSEPVALLMLKIYHELEMRYDAARQDYSRMPRGNSIAPAPGPCARCHDGFAVVIFTAADNFTRRLTSNTTLISRLITLVRLSGYRSDR